MYTARGPGVSGLHSDSGDQHGAHCGHTPQSAKMHQYLEKEGETSLGYFCGNLGLLLQPAFPPETVIFTVSRCRKPLRSYIHLLHYYIGFGVLGCF